HDEDVRVSGTDPPAPGLGVFVLVFGEPRVPRLVEQRQVHLGQVDQVDLEPAVLRRVRVEPVGDRLADPARPGAADDDLQRGLQHAPTLVPWPAKALWVTRTAPRR